MHYADLEIAIRKRNELTYALSFRFNGPDDDAEQRSEPDPEIEFDPTSVRNFFPDEYGRQLGEAFFSEAVRLWFGRFRTAAQTQNAILRVRLSIDSSAPELHAVHWETLRDPDAPDAPLFMGEQTIVSRFLASGQDWRPIRLRPKAALTALVVIASPSQVGQQKLEPIDVPWELAQARTALGEVGPTQITELAPNGPVSLNEISARLRDGFDILYLICHGILEKQEPYLYLEAEERTRGADFVQRIRELDQRPRLIVLASCQSAGKRGVAFSGLGPRLAEAGVPAVVAMQDSVSMETSSSFMKRFFTELLKDGQIDRAMSIARGDVRNRDDYWMPVLFLRLRNGRIWYVPGFDGERTEFEQWGSICRFVQDGACVPIIGPDVAEHIFGGVRMIASDIAQKNRFPLDGRDRSDLAKVAQFVLTQNSLEYVQREVIDGLIGGLQKAGSRLIGPPAEAMDVPDLMEAIVTKLVDDEKDPLKIVAALNAKVFVHASFNSLLEMFLTKTKINGKVKQPVPLVTEWRDERRDDLHPAEFPGEPSVEKPLVYYVFGKAQQTSTWVLTEDDFFDYLIRTTRYQLMPPVVSDALVTGSLLFLGFPLDDWKFRVLFRMILAKGGRQLLQGYNHVGVQLDPDETTIDNARRAKKYFERYFSNSKIDIYWGTAADFLRELKTHLDSTPSLRPEKRSAAANRRSI
jgi:hypothetical protein